MIRSRTCLWLLVVAALGWSLPAAATEPGFERCAAIKGRRIARRLACEKRLRDLHTAQPPGKVTVCFSELAAAPLQRKARRHEVVRGRAGSRVGKLVDAAPRDVRAARATAALLARDPDRALGLIAAGILDRRALEVPTIRGAIVRIFSHHAVPWVRALGRKLATEPTAALDELDSETVRVALADLDGPPR